MKASVIVFPASNCDRDVAVALERVTGTKPAMVWHGETDLPPSDLVVLPGGFSFGDYLRSGAMAARSPIMGEVVARAKAGTPVLGICNGFQILTEAQLLPGALMRNAGLHFVCKEVPVTVERPDLPYTNKFCRGETLRLHVAHHDGNYFADEATLDRLEGEGRVAFRYTENPNGSARDIAGIADETGKILGMMPHPERSADGRLGHKDGRRLFESVMEALS
jgi:phosphoribosylformylglycinamidine synthase